MIRQYSFLLFVCVYLSYPNSVFTFPMVTPDGPCEMIKNNAQEQVNESGEYHPIPDCDQYGYYKPVQCDLRGCRCVDSYGNPTKEFHPPKYYIIKEDCQRHNTRL